MKVAVVGAGAIGAYVGAALQRGGAEVSMVARGAHLQAMRERGLRVLSPRGNFSVEVVATDDPSRVGPVDVIFLGLKAYSYASCGKLIEPLMGNRTAVVAAQNGIPWWYFYGLETIGHLKGHRVEAVDPGGAVSAVIPPEHAIGCVVYCSTTIESPGVIRHTEGTRFTIGEPDGSMSKRCQGFSEAMEAGGLKCPVERDVRKDVWLKLMGNISFNPLSVLTGATMSGICGHAETRALVARMMEETLAVATALGSAPEISVERRLAGAERVGEHKTSTLQDFEAGKAMELDVLMKAPIELADMVGVEVPSLKAVYAVVSYVAEHRVYTRV